MSLLIVSDKTPTEPYHYQSWSTAHPFQILTFPLRILDMALRYLRGWLDSKKLRLVPDEASLLREIRRGKEVLSQRDLSQREALEHSYRDGMLLL